MGVAGTSGPPPRWPPAARPQTDEARRQVLAITQAREARGLADELADDLAALARWARPAVAEDARRLQTQLLKGPSIAAPAARGRYLQLWIHGVRPPTEASLDPSTWDDVLREVFEDTKAEAREASGEIARAAVVAAAGVAVVGLIILAVKE